MNMTRIAIFGDPHANSHATETVLDDIDAAQVDHVCCLGDLNREGWSPCMIG